MGPLLLLLLQSYPSLRLALRTSLSPFLPLLPLNINHQRTRPLCLLL
jgi:hypothetical protein